MAGKTRATAIRTTATIDRKLLALFDALPPKEYRGKKLERLMRAALVKAKLADRVPPSTNGKASARQVREAVPMS